MRYRNLEMQSSVATLVSVYRLFSLSGSGSESESGCSECVCRMPFTVMPHSSYSGPAHSNRLRGKDMRTRTEVGGFRENVYSGIRRKSAFQLQLFFFSRSVLHFRFIDFNAHRHTVPTGHRHAGRRTTSMYGK